MKKSIILLFFLSLSCVTNESISGNYINRKEKYETLIINKDLSYARTIDMGMIKFTENGFLQKINLKNYLITDSIISRKPIKYEIIEKDSLNLKNETVFDFFDIDDYPISYIELNLIKQRDTVKSSVHSNRIVLSNDLVKDSEIYIYMLGYWPINYLPKNSESNYFKITMYESPFNHYYDNSFIKFFEFDTIVKKKNKLKIRGNDYLKKNKVR